MADTSTARSLAVSALRANPVVHPTEAQLEALQTLGANVTFEELGMDSMARMELSIWLELELGIELSEQEIHEVGSVEGLTALIARNMPARA